MPWATMVYWSRRWWLLAVKPSTCSAAGRLHALDAAGDDEVLEARRGCPAAAKLTACWPEPQKRLRVTPGASSDQPASSAAIRAMSIAWSPLPAPQPMTTSSTSAVSNPLRSRSALSTWARIRCGWTLCSAPVLLALAARRAHGVDDPSLIFHAAIVAASAVIARPHRLRRLWRMAHDHSHGGGARAGAAPRRAAEAVVPPDRRLPRRPGRRRDRPPVRWPCCPTPATWPPTPSGWGWRWRRSARRTAPSTPPTARSACTGWRSSPRWPTPCCCSPSPAGCCSRRSSACRTRRTSPRCRCSSSACSASASTSSRSCCCARAPRRASTCAAPTSR